MNPKWKHVITWLILIPALLGVAVSYAAIWVLLAYFATGVDWYAGLALLVSGPYAGAGAILAYSKPRQNLALTLGISGFVLWAMLWVLCFTVLGFRVG
jgi:hypothetical protein